MEKIAEKFISVNHTNRKGIFSSSFSFAPCNYMTKIFFISEPCKRESSSRVWNIQTVSSCSNILIINQVYRYTRSVDKANCGDDDEEMNCVPWNDEFLLVPSSFFHCAAHTAVSAAPERTLKFYDFHSAQARKEEKNSKQHSRTTQKPVDNVLSGRGVSPSFSILGTWSVNVHQLASFSLSPPRTDIISCWP